MGGRIHGVREHLPASEYAKNHVLDPLIRAISTNLRQHTLRGDQIRFLLESLEHAKSWNDAGHPGRSQEATDDISKSYAEIIAWVKDLRPAEGDPRLLPAPREGERLVALQERDLLWLAELVATSPGNPNQSIMIARRLRCSHHTPAFDVGKQECSCMECKTRLEA